MNSTTMESLLLFVILGTMLTIAEAQIGIPQIIVLLDSVNDTSSIMASSLEAHRKQTTASLTQITNTQTQLSSSLDALETDFNQTTSETRTILSQMARNQAQMASTLNQVVLMLQGKMLYIKV